MLGPVGVVRDHHAAGAGGDDLVAVEAVDAHVAHGAGHAARQRALGVAGAQRLGRVLDEHQVVFFCQRQKGGHVGHVAEDVHHHDGPHPRAGALVVAAAAAHLTVLGEKPFRQGRVHAQRVVTADEHRLCPHIADGVHRRDKGERRGQHLVPAAHTRHQIGQMQAGGAAVAGHRGGHACVPRHFLLKLAHQAAAGGDPLADDRAVDVLFFVARKVGHGQGYEFFCHHDLIPFFAAINWIKSASHCSAEAARAGRIKNQNT